MLKDNLYTIRTKNVLSESEIELDIQLDQEHEIFKGHFPQQAVLPGVCLIDMLTEILSEHLNKPLQLTEASAVKYLRMVTPDKDSNLKLKLIFDQQESGVALQASSLLEDASTNMKFKGVYKY
ncbi:MAG: hypothetical protein CL843_07920 [Crocinitomicaceae bacterium]|nr:hypothetical protein [Crocinitomicaceae bacterium]